MEHNIVEWLPAAFRDNPPDVYVDNINRLVYFKPQPRVSINWVEIVTGVTVIAGVAAFLIGCLLLSAPQ